MGSRFLGWYPVKDGPPDGETNGVAYEDNRFNVNRLDIYPTYTQVLNPHDPSYFFTYGYPAGANPNSYGDPPQVKMGVSLWHVETTPGVMTLVDSVGTNYAPTFSGTPSDFDFNSMPGKAVGVRSNLGSVAGFEVGITKWSVDTSGCSTDFDVTHDYASAIRTFYGNVPVDYANHTPFMSSSCCFDHSGNIWVFTSVWGTMFRKASPLTDWENPAVIVWEKVSGSSGASLALGVISEGALSGSGGTSHVSGGGNNSSTSISVPVAYTDSKILVPYTVIGNDDADAIVHLDAGVLEINSGGLVHQESFYHNTETAGTSFFVSNGTQFSRGWGMGSGDYAFAIQGQVTSDAGFEKGFLGYDGAYQFYLEDDEIEGIPTSFPTSGIGLETWGHPVLLTGPTSDPYELLYQATDTDTPEELEAALLTLLGADDWGDTPYADLDEAVNAIAGFYGPPPWQITLGTQLHRFQGANWEYDGADGQSAGPPDFLVQFNNEDYGNTSDLANGKADQALLSFRFVGYSTTELGSWASSLPSDYTDSLDPSPNSEYLVVWEIYLDAPDPGPEPEPDPIGFINRLRHDGLELFSGSTTVSGNVDGPVLTARFTDTGDLTTVWDQVQRKPQVPGGNRFFFMDSNVLKMIAECSLEVITSICSCEIIYADEDTLPGTDVWSLRPYNNASLNSDGSYFYAVADEIGAGPDYVVIRWPLPEMDSYEVVYNNENEVTFGGSINGPLVVGDTLFFISNNQEFCSVPLSGGDPTILFDLDASYGVPGPGSNASLWNPAYDGNLIWMPYYYRTGPGVARTGMMSMTLDGNETLYEFSNTTGTVGPRLLGNDGGTMATDGAYWNLSRYWETGPEFRLTRFDTVTHEFTSTDETIDGLYIPVPLKNGRVRSTNMDNAPIIIGPDMQLVSGGDPCSGELEGDDFNLIADHWVATSQDHSTVVFANWNDGIVRCVSLA